MFQNLLGVAQSNFVLLLFLFSNQCNILLLLLLFSKIDNIELVVMWPDIMVNVGTENCCN